MTEETTDTSDQDLVAIAATPAATVAGGFVMVSGLFTTLLAIQTWDMLRTQGIALVATVLLFLLGPPNLYLGWNIRKVRGWAASAAFGLCVAAAVLLLFWAVFALWNGFVSLLAFASAPLNASAAAAAHSRIKPGKRADVARLRLAEQGLEGGL